MMWLQSDDLRDRILFQTIAKMTGPERYEAEWFLYSILARKAARAAEQSRAQQAEKCSS